MWSEKLPHLFPGTIAEEDEDDDHELDFNYINVDLDDGDNRDVHLDNIRFLPSDYPLVGKLFKIFLTRIFSKDSIEGSKYLFRMPY